MTNRSKYILLPLITFSFLWSFRLEGEPMDGKAAERLPLFRSLVADAKLGKVLTPEQGENLRAGLRSGDPVLSSIAAWCIGEMGVRGRAFENDLMRVKAPKDSMTEAFVILAEKKIELQSTSMREKIRSYVALATESHNPYLRVESAKALLRLDRTQGKQALSLLARDNQSVTSETASRILRVEQIADGETPVPPVPPSGDELFETVLSITDPPAVH